MSEEIDCNNCYYNRGGCRCEDEMAAGCIYTPLTDKDKEEMAENALTHFKETVRNIESIVSDPVFIKAYKKHYKENFGSPVHK